MDQAACELRDVGERCSIILPQDSEDDNVWVIGEFCILIDFDSIIRYIHIYITWSRCLLERKLNLDM